MPEFDHDVERGFVGHLGVPPARDAVAQDGVHHALRLLPHGARPDHAEPEFGGAEGVVMVPSVSA